MYPVSQGEPARRLWRSDGENFYYTYKRRLLEGDRVIREKTWKETIRRDFQ